jgi:hypothetical protein
MEALLGEFRRGNIADRERSREDAAIRDHLSGLSQAWDLVLPAFPPCPWKRRTCRWEYYRGRRDAYLLDLIAAIVPANEPHNGLLVNPAAVFGRHARRLARDLPDREIVATDIDSGWNRLYRTVSWWAYPGLRNYRFEQENIFEPDVSRHPAAVAFFGACGAVTDGCMDYALAVRSPFLICRSCCHDNIGGNTEVVRRPTPINAFFAWKNKQYEKIKHKKSWAGYYHAARYAREAYPRSRTAREMMDEKTIFAIARNSADSDICRSLIDLDRCLYLEENGYDVLYREELFFAHRRPDASSGDGDTPS